MTDEVQYDPVARPNVDPPNRGYQNKFESGDSDAIQMTLEKIDETVINYLSNVIKPTVKENDRVLPVPVMYAFPERWKAIRKDGYMRDQKNDKVQLPLLTIRRTLITRNSMTNPSNKYVYRTHQAQWNARNAYDRFAALNNVVPSMELRNVIVPDYVDLTYELIAWTDFQSQMNEILEQINVENEEFWGVRNNYKFRVKIEEYTSESDLPPTRDRMVRNMFNMVVSAYLVPEKYVRDFATATGDSKLFTSKKTVTFVEIDATGTANPRGVATPRQIEEYYSRIRAIPENER